MRRIFSAIFLFLCLTACSNIKDTAEQPVELSDIQPTWSIKRVWQHSLGGEQASTSTDLLPVVRGDNVYAINTQGKVFAFNALTGKSVWRVETRKVVSAGLGGNDETLFFGEQNGSVIALSSDDGRVLWSKNINTELSVAPVANDEYVVVLGSDGTIFCLSALSGDVIWTKQTNVPALSLKGNARPFLIGGVVYLGLDNGQVVAFVLDNGRGVWRSTVGLQRGKTELDRLADVDMLTVDLDGALFASAYNGITVLMNPRNGQLGWQRNIASAATAQVDSENLYLVDVLSKIWKLNKRSGQTEWVSEKLRARAVSGVAPVHSNALVVTDFEGYVHVLDVASGQIVGRKRIFDKPLSGDIVFAHGYYYMLSVDGRLVAIKLKALRTSS